MAEHALKDGRLDDAHELVTASDLRDHRRAQKVLLRLVPAYMERARRRLTEGQHADALADLDKATAAGTSLDEIGTLREEVLASMNRQRREVRQRKETLEAAADRIAGGSVGAGRAILDRVDDDSQARRLRDDADNREKAIQTAMADARRLLDAGQLGGAVEALRKARTLYPRATGLAELEAHVCDAVLTNTRSSIETGALHRAADEMALLGDLGAALPARQELRRILDLAGEAATATDARRIPDAITHLRKLSHLLPGCSWVTTALGRLVDAQSNLDEVVGGPLGSFAAVQRRIDEPGKAHAMATPPVRERAPSTEDTIGVDTVPERLLVSVDDGGGYLVLRSNRISIGRAGPGSTADLALFANLSDRHFEIARIDDDYFLFARSPIEVSGEKVTQKLLHDGDRIRVGRRGRITFRQPSRMSASAVLDLGEGLRSYNDVRRVVLFDRHALVGPHAHCHIAARGGELTLFERSGRFWLRETGNSRELVRSRGPARAVPMGQYVGESGVGLSIRPWTNGTSTRT